jgi:hypothetical protein
VTRAASFALVAVVAMLSLAGSAGGSGSAARPFKIIAMSHTHPAGQTYSWVCAKITKTVAGRATVTATRGGPGQLRPKTIRWKGTRIVAFKITTAGRYTIKVARKGARTVSKSYTVPDPPDPANGLFPCV